MKKKILLTTITTSLLFGFVSCGQSATTRYTVTLDPNGGTVEQSSIAVNAGSTAELPIPEKNGRTFQGWFTGWTSEDVEYKNTTKINSDVTLYAKWDKYTAEYRNYDNTIYESRLVNPGEKALNIDPDENKAKGSFGRPADDSHCYYFDGWDFDFNTPLNSDTPIPSKWREESVTHSTFKYSSYFIDDREYDLKFINNDNLFEGPSNVFSRNLASYSLSLNAARLDDLDSFLKRLGYSDIYYSDDFYGKHDGHTFAQKDFGNQKVITVIVKGQKYGVSWADNFDIGLEGPHHGFETRAHTVYEELKNYLATYQGTSYKLFVTGYSRAGAITSMLTRELLLNNDIDVSNLYVYTFETPRSIPEDLIKQTDYSSVFNIVNDADIITYVLPYEYDKFVRPGSDIHIYRDDLDDLLKEFDPELNVGTFAPSSEYETEPDFAQYLINAMMSYNADETLTLRSREEFYNNWQDTFVYALRLAFGLKQETLNTIMADIKEKGMSVLVQFLMPDGLYNYLNPFVKADGIEYNEDELKGYCNKLVKFVTGPGATIVAKYASLQRLISMHVFDINYSLLLKY